MTCLRVGVEGRWRLVLDGAGRSDAAGDAETEAAGAHLMPKLEIVPQGDHWPHTYPPIAGSPLSQKTLPLGILQ